MNFDSAFAESEDKQSHKRGNHLDPYSGIINASVLSANARLLELSGGLYSISIGSLADLANEGQAAPATLIAGMAGDGPASVEVIGLSSGMSNWIGPHGGMVVLKVQAPGGRVMITTYRNPDQQIAPLEIRLSRLDAQPPVLSNGVDPNGLAIEQGAPDGAPIEVVLCLADSGDRLFKSEDWAGQRGGRQRIEAFSLRSLGALSDAEIEYKAFGPQRRETPWVTAGKLCGSRGRGMPLVGYAARLKGAAAERFDVEYTGSFFEAGEADRVRNGEPCRAKIHDDPLEALLITLVPRSG